MNIKISGAFPGIILLIIFSLYSCNKKNNFILNENFDSNKLAWVEESSSFHCVKIDSGYYYISNCDTSTLTEFTSTTSLDKSYLYNLPKSFEICTKIKLMYYKHKATCFGILLNGASLQYAFNINKLGAIQVREYDYNSNKDELLLSRDSEYEIDHEVICKILINDGKFTLYMDDYKIGESRFNVNALQELRLFTSKESKIAVDYLTIKKTDPRNH
jgi:hypothetical protein